jgi:hypothetical protein
VRCAVSGIGAAVSVDRKSARQGWKEGNEGMIEQVRFIIGGEQPFIWEMLPVWRVALVRAMKWYLICRLAKEMTEELDRAGLGEIPVL